MQGTMVRRKGPYSVGAVYTLLDGLGKTGDGVAQRLAELKVRGYPKKFSGCPVAVLIYSRFPGVQVEVLADCVEIVYGDEFWDCKVPEAVGQFIKEFDAGRHKRLRTGWVGVVARIIRP